MRNVRGASRFGTWAIACCAFLTTGCSGVHVVKLSSTRIADPKLDGGGVEVAFQLQPAGSSKTLVAEVLKGPTVVAQVWTGTVSGGAPAVQIAWDGRDSTGRYVDTGDYTFRLRGAGSRPAPVDIPVTIVRLGITEIEALASLAGNDEWQMVYFMKGINYAFYATPAIHEYLSVAESGQVSDLDLDNGDARPVPPVHAATDSPALEGANYEDDNYNYPLCYLVGATPRLEVTFGGGATSASGVAMSPNYPVPGLDLRVEARLNGAALSASVPINPGGSAVLNGPVLPSEVTRVDYAIDWVWQYRESGSSSWTDIPGKTTIPLRFYTVIGKPNFKSGAVGTQYAGPWVEAAEYWHQWRQNLGTTTNTEAACVETHVKGFFGQNSGIPTAIEGMVYDAFPVGGDGGATHYLQWGPWNMELSSLLNNHDNGVFFNCSDNMGSTTTMLAMMGVRNVRAVHLGNMTLRAIWGIGTAGYTKDLWGPGSHGFSYHHIVTRDDGIHVIDTCMQLDEDGSPDATPGVPGWNFDRPWSGPGGYDDLSATNAVTTTLQLLPGLE